jgi:hypothetical protein
LASAGVEPSRCLGHAVRNLGDRGIRTRCISNAKSHVHRHDVPDKTPSPHSSAAIAYVLRLVSHSLPSLSLAHPLFLRSATRSIRLLSLAHSCCRLVEHEHTTRLPCEAAVAVSYTHTHSLSLSLALSLSCRSRMCTRAT